MNEAKTKLPTERGFTASDGSGYFNAESIIRSQEYMLKRQQELLDACMKRNQETVNALNSFALENEKLRRELKGHREGKLWTMLVSLLPTQEMVRK